MFAPRLGARISPLPPPRSRPKIVESTGVDRVCQCRAERGIAVMTAQIIAVSIAMIAIAHAG